MIIRRLLALLVSAALLAMGPAAPVAAQVSNAIVVATCGTPPATYSAGANRQITQDTTGKLCSGGGGSAGSVTQGTSPWVTQDTASTFVSSSALAANQVITAVASKRLVSFNVSADSTLSAAAWWVMVYNATSAPVDGAVTPAKCYAMPSGSTAISATFASNSPTFSTGITIGVSTTGCFTKTASTHAFISADFL